jgi:hypothetical protein
MSLQASFLPRFKLQLFVPRMIMIVALFLAPALVAQVQESVVPGNIVTPEIHLGSATEPSTITVPPVMEVTSTPPEPDVSNAPPASTELLATRHFDFVVSPISQELWTRGSMADTSISLGDYARELRAEKQRTKGQGAPNAMAGPADSEPTNSEPSNSK